MASKSISRILNRSIENINSNSFDELNESDDSFTTFYFEDEKSNEEDDDCDMKSAWTESYYSKQQHEESFSRRAGHVFEHFEKERKYLGEITSVDSQKRTFSATVNCSDDLINRDVVFSFDDIPPEYISSIEVGRRIIYIFGKQYCNGTVTNISNLYFRKDSNWTKREIELKRKEAKELYKLLNNKVDEEND